MTVSIINKPNLLVVGGGPAGLTTAIAAKKAGLSKITVLEKRPQYSRARPVALTETTANNLKWMGVELPDSSRILEYHLGVFKPEKTVKIPYAQTSPKALEAPSYDIKAFERALATHSVLINSLEHYLLQSALQHGIQVISGAKVLALREARNHAEIFVDVIQQSKMTTIPANYVAITGGSKSSDLAPGVKRKKYFGSEEAILWGIVNHPSRDYLLYIGSGHQPRRMLRFGTAEVTGFAFSIGSQLQKHLRDNPHEMEKYVLQHMPIIGLDQEQIVDLQLLERASSFATRAVTGGRIFILGDAYRTVSPWTGFGVNLAVRDGVQMGETLKKLSKDPHLQEAIIREHVALMEETQRFMSYYNHLLGANTQDLFPIRLFQRHVKMGPLTHAFALRALEIGFHTFYGSHLL